MKKVLNCALAIMSAAAFCLQMLAMFEDARLAFYAVAAEILAFICGTANIVARIYALQ